jgi:hypothetical protein
MKKIKITEEQLKKVVNLVTEQKYDDAIETYQKEKSREISMSRDEARLMYNLAQNWCEGNVSHPDCTEIDELGKKLKIS